MRLERYQPQVAGRDAFHRVPFLGLEVRDAVERVPTRFMLLMLLWLQIYPGLRAAAPPPRPPTIITQPQDQIATVGSEARFSVEPGQSFTPLRYQWLFNGLDFSGATNALLILTNVQPAHAGTYMVVVKNSVSKISSSPALLTVVSLTPPSIITPPQSQPVVPGATVTFNVVAAGSEPLQYQWQFNGADLLNRTSSTLILENVQASQAGTYSVRVANSAGSVNSPAATLTITSPAPPVNFQLTALPLAQSALFQLRATASAGQSVVLEASTDLRTWSPVFTNAAANGAVDFTDADTGKFNQRFYRGRIR